MIQFVPEGRELAGPVKSSLHTRLQPDGVPGTEACAVTAAVTDETSAATTAAAARRHRPGDAGLRYTRGVMSDLSSGKPGDGRRRSLRSQRRSERWLAGLSADRALSQKFRRHFRTVSICFLVVGISW